MPDYDDISLERVIEDREFYKLEGNYWLRSSHALDEALRIHYGIYLMRVEILRLRAKLVGLQDSMVHDYMPEYQGASIDIRVAQSHRLALLQQAEYLRAELIIQAANERRHRKK